MGYYYEIPLQSVWSLEHVTKALRCVNMWHHTQFCGSLDLGRFNTLIVEGFSIGVCSERLACG